MFQDRTPLPICKKIDVERIEGHELGCPSEVSS